VIKSINKEQNIVLDGSLLLTAYKLILGIGNQLSTDAFTMILPWLCLKKGSATYVGYTLPQKLISCPKLM